MGELSIMHTHKTPFIKMKLSIYNCVYSTAASLWPLFGNHIIVVGSSKNHLRNE